jgi:hypothetical protein
VQVEFHTSKVELAPGEAALLFKHDGAIAYLNSARLDDLEVSIPTRMVLVVAAILDTENDDLWVELKHRVEKRLVEVMIGTAGGN